LKHEQLLLKNQLCFPLYAAAKEVVRLYKPHLDRLGLTYTQYITMMALWEHRSANIKTLGEYLNLDSGTLTPLLQKLEQRGYIRRERSDEDERIVNVQLTEIGDALQDEAADIPAMMRACLPLSDADARQLYTLLYRVLGKQDE
jgi:DNA-binding MarR family transcriptional regulator